MKMRLLHFHTFISILFVLLSLLSDFVTINNDSPYQGNAKNDQQ